MEQETFEFECLVCSDKCMLPKTIKEDKKRWYKIMNSDNLGSMYKGGIEIRPRLEKLRKYEYLELKCNHVFHSECFIESEKVRKNTNETYGISYMCPYCRTTERYVKPLIIKQSIDKNEDNTCNKITMNEKCKAKTKLGKDCVHKPLKDSEYCGIHIKQSKQ